MSGCASRSTSARAMSAERSRPASRRAIRVLRPAAWLAVALLALSVPMPAAAQATDVDYQRDPSVVLLVVALLVAFTAIGLAFPIAWRLNNGRPPLPISGARATADEDEDGDELPWMPGGDILERSSDAGTERGS